jgi:ribA/ribD-fused uncharacterized protein
MSYYLFLDDSREPSKVTWKPLPENVHWVIAKSYDEFVKLLRDKGIPKFVAYDCDLCQEHYDAYFNLKGRYVLHYNAFKEKCGIHCVEHILKLCKDAGVDHPEFVIHTRNKYAEPVMESMIRLFNAKTEAKPSQVRPDTTIPAYARHSDEYICGFFGEYRFLSNFWPVKVEFKGLKFHSVEAAYQAAKCSDESQRKLFVEMTPQEAKKAGRKVKLPDDWESKSYSIMYYLVFQKFSVHQELRKRLIDTGSKLLEESNNWRDNKWGQHYECENGIWRVKELGSNLLGSILGAVRQGLK